MLDGIMAIGEQIDGFSYKTYLQSIPHSTTNMGLFGSPKYKLDNKFVNKKWRGYFFKFLILMVLLNHFVAAVSFLQILLSLAFYCTNSPMNI